MGSVIGKKKGEGGGVISGEPEFLYTPALEAFYTEAGVSVIKRVAYTLTVKHIKWHLLGKRLYVANIG